MTLKQKFDNVEVMFEGQQGQLRYDESCGASKECEVIADEFAVSFAEWTCIYAYKYPKCNFMELLEIYKKEKGL